MILEDIYAALFALAWDGATFKNPRATARTLRHWNDVPASERPALFLAQGHQTALPKKSVLEPTRWMLGAKLYVYVSTSGAASPGQVLNPIMDALKAKFEPTAVAPQRLGGLVEWARIEGAIETSEGTLGGLEVAIVPITMLAA